MHPQSTRHWVYYYLNLLPNIVEINSIIMYKLALLTILSLFLTTTDANAQSRDFDGIWSGSQLPLTAMTNSPCTLKTTMSIPFTLTKIWRQSQVQNE